MLAGNPRCVQEYGVASKPAPKFNEQMDLAVDSLCQLLFGMSSTTSSAIHAIASMVPMQSVAAGTPCAT